MSKPTLKLVMRWQYSLNSLLKTSNSIYNLMRPKKRTPYSTVNISIIWCNWTKISDSCVAVVREAINHIIPFNICSRFSQFSFGRFWVSWTCCSTFRRISHRSLNDYRYYVCSFVHSVATLIYTFLLNRSNGFREISNIFSSNWSTVSTT